MWWLISVGVLLGAVVAWRRSPSPQTLGEADQERLRETTQLSTSLQQAAKHMGLSLRWEITQESYVFWGAIHSCKVKSVVSLSGTNVARTAPTWSQLEPGQAQFSERATSMLVEVDLTHTPARSINKRALPVDDLSSWRNLFDESLCKRLQKSFQLGASELKIEAGMLRIQYDKVMMDHSILTRHIDAAEAARAIQYDLRPGPLNERLWSFIKQIAPSMVLLRPLTREALWTAISTFPDDPELQAFCKDLLSPKGGLTDEHKHGLYAYLLEETKDQTKALYLKMALAEEAAAIRLLGHQHQDPQRGNEAVAKMLMEEPLEAALFEQALQWLLATSPRDELLALLLHLRDAEEKKKQKTVLEALLTIATEQLSSHPKSAFYKAFFNKLSSTLGGPLGPEALHPLLYEWEWLWHVARGGPLEQMELLSGGLLTLASTKRMASLYTTLARLDEVEFERLLEDILLHYLKDKSEGTRHELQAHELNALRALGLCGGVHSIPVLRRLLQVIPNTTHAPLVEQTIKRIQSRLTHAKDGQLSLSSTPLQEEEGKLSLQDEYGELAIVYVEDAQIDPPQANTTDVTDLK